jgi:N6-L-threonylcarbamoyladenine synthase
MMTILAIETSCDETSVAIFKDKKLLSNEVYSQIDIHKKFGGVVPEIASRDHVKKIDWVFNTAIKNANININAIDAVAVTYGPGLIGPLLIGISFAKGLALALNKPLIGVNHLIGHMNAIFIENPQLKPPLLFLIVSGGHTELVHMKDFDNLEVLGHSIDDSVGEAFDKVARILDLGYPGGPVVDKISKGRDEKFVRFPRPLINSNNLDFSFSGLKTSVLYYVKKQDWTFIKKHTPDIAASFQKAVVDILISKTLKAHKDINAPVCIVGGVAANSRLREEFSKKDINVYYPSIEYCTDNAAMIGYAAYHKLEKKEFENMNLNAIPYLDIE